MASRVLTRKQKGTITGNFLRYKTEIYAYNIEARKHHIYHGLSYSKECRIWPHMTTHNEVHPCLTQLSEIPPPAQLHSSYYCILSFVPSNDGDNCFVPFCWCFFCFSVHYFVVFNTWELSEGENEQMRITAPYAENVCASRRTARRTQAHLHETEWI